MSLKLMTREWVRSSLLPDSAKLRAQSKTNTYGVALPMAMSLGL